MQLRPYWRKQCIEWMRHCIHNFTSPKCTHGAVLSPIAIAMTNEPCLCTNIFKYTFKSIWNDWNKSYARFIFLGCWRAPIRFIPLFRFNWMLRADSIFSFCFFAGWSSQHVIRVFHCVHGIIWARYSGNVMCKIIDAMEIRKKMMEIRCESLYAVQTKKC